MKKLTLKIVFAFLIPLLGFSQIGIGTTAPHSSSALEISSTTSGILIPRMTEVQRNAITAPATGLMIYQTNASPGFYYYSSSTWSPFLGSSSGWDIAGNGGTNATSNFLGTTDATDLVFRTNNAERLRMLSNGTIGINNALPNVSSALDISSTSKGILIPRMTETQRNAITSPATSLLIYQTNNTPGYYYYTGSAWSALINNGWNVSGNTGTNATSNFIGTADNTDLVVRTNNTEKMRVLSNGNVGIGTTSPNAKLHILSQNSTSVFAAGFEGNTLSPFVASGTSFGWNVQSNGGNFNSGIRGARSGGGNDNGNYILDLTQTISANGGTIAFAFKVDSETGFDFLRFFIDGVQQNQWSGNIAWNTVSFAITGGTHTFRWAYVKNNSVNTGADRAWIDDVEITTNSSVLRIEDGSQGNGRILVSDANGFTSWQSPSSAITSNWSLSGNTGTTPGTNFMGTSDNQSLVFKTNNNEYSRVLSNGRVGIGTTTPAVKLHVEDDALGLAVIRAVNTNTNTSNLSYGIRGESNSTALGSAGVIGISTNSGQNEMGVVGDYGLWGAAVFGLGWASAYTDMPTSRDFGIFGTCNWTTGTGVYAIDKSNSSGSYAYYGIGKIAVTGSKSASVPTTKGNQLVYCTESPEIWFEDLGGGKLVNGQIHIALDPMYLETIFISDEHKMRVFLQEEGDSNGLIVIKDADNKGFTVKEKNGGTSNIEFSYRIMAKRRFYQDHRFGVDSNQPFENNLIKAKDVPATTTDPEVMKRYVEEQRLLKEAQHKSNPTK